MLIKISYSPTCYRFQHNGIKRNMNIQFLLMGETIFIQRNAEIVVPKLTMVLSGYHFAALLFAYTLHWFYILKPEQNMPFRMVFQNNWQLHHSNMQLNINQFDIRNIINRIKLHKISSKNQSREQRLNIHTPCRCWRGNTAGYVEIRCMYTSFCLCVRYGSIAI